MPVKHIEPKNNELEITEVLYALSDATRLQIVQMLSSGKEMACGEFDFGMPKSSLSHHFRVLRNAGVVTTRKEGTTLLNKLRRADLDERFPEFLKSILKAAER